MNQEYLIKKIKQKAKQDSKNRKNPRFLNVAGFLIAKGFLNSNLEIPLKPNKKLKVQDCIWAGKNVEPRILEVLPAAILRLEKHFDLDKNPHKALMNVISALKQKSDYVPLFYGISFEKIKAWINLPLKDGRIKLLSEKKITKTFRLKPSSIEKLRQLSHQKNCSEATLLEDLLLAS